ncbi:MAG: hypothetical protein QOG72_2531 [Sphingomonadales bacterium]|nr:hypothetical protein [Sphingomonadales bacterium]
MRNLRKSPFSLIMAILILAGAAGGPRAGAQPPLPMPKPKPAPAVPVQAVDDIFSSLKDAGSPGCAVSVSRAGRTLITRSYGASDLEHGVRISPKSVFEAGSISKQFTAASILLLVQDGKLRLDDDVRRYVPELPDYGVPVTLAHLLSHTSGLRDWGDAAQIAGWRNGKRVFSNADALQIIFRQRSANATPGDYFEYTGTGYVLLAEVVQRVSGKSLAEFTRERLFKPLNMGDTSWREDFRRIVPNRALGYRRIGEETLLYMPFMNVVGPDGLLTTVDDLLTWNAALDSGALGPFVTRELQREAHDNGGRPLGYARGLWVAVRDGQREVSHGGQTGGFQATLLRYPDQQLSVVLLCNGFEITSNDFGHRLAALYLPPPPSPAPTGGAPISAAEAERYAGTFVDEAASQMATAAATSEGLTWRGGLLRAVARGRFESSDGETIVFQGPDRVEVIEENGVASTFARLKDPSPGPEALAGLEGTYHSDELRADYEVSIQGGELHLHNPDTGYLSGVFKAAGGDLFAVPGILVRFRRDPAGRGSAFSLGIRRAHFDFRHVPPR